MSERCYRSTIVTGILERPLAIFAVIAILTILLADCDGPGTNTLRDTSWNLASLAGRDVLPGTTITIEFTGDQVSGSAGCNHYQGSYKASGNSFSVTGVFATEMGCLEPTGILEQETEYLTALRVAARYQVDGERFEILNETGTIILVFVASSSDTLAMATAALEQPSPVPASPTAQTLEVAPTPAIKPPAGSKRYLDSVVGVSVLVPESWVVVEVDPGRLATLQSYPEGKYIGGKATDHTRSLSASQPLTP